MRVRLTNLGALRARRDRVSMTPARLAWPLSGRRNLNDDQRSIVAWDLQEIRSRIARVERAKVAGQAGGVGRSKVQNSSPAELSGKLKPKQYDRSKETRRAIAKDTDCKNEEEKNGGRGDLRLPRHLTSGRSPASRGLSPRLHGQRKATSRAPCQGSSTARGGNDCRR